MLKSEMGSIVMSAHKLLNRQRTLEVNEVTSLYREPGVLSGYRLPKQKLMYYLISAFQINNETINVWTHSAGFIIILCELLSLLKEFGTDDPRITPLLAFCVCGMLYTSLSVIAHAVHSYSTYMHYTCLHADYVGIGLYGFSSVLPVFYICADMETRTWLNPWFLPLNVFLSWMVCFFCCIAKVMFRRPYPFKKKLCQTVPLCLHLVLVFICLHHRFTSCHDDPLHSCDSPSLYHNKKSLILVFVAGISFSSHLPERLWPGYFDFIGQGHQVFHVVSIIINLAQMEAARWDIAHPRLDASYELTPRLSTFLFVIAGYCLCCIVTVVALEGGVQLRVKEDKIEEEGQMASGNDTPTGDGSSKKGKTD